MASNTDTIDLASARPSVQFNPEQTTSLPLDESKKQQQQSPKLAESNSFPGHLEMPLTKTNSSTRTNGSSKSNSRRNSLAAFAERLRSRSRSHSRSRSQGRNSLDLSYLNNGNRSSLEEEREDGSVERKSSDSGFDYDAIIKAQHDFMENLRAEQLRKNIHTNIDGLPITPPMHRRRSSITQMLGMDKALLAR
ncbi:hypothetical protein BG004_004838 [Podila humilis]|nr:hypothetical protein BG004_004838 [Podila humilis]